MKETVLGEVYFSFSKKELKNLDKYILHSQWKASETIVKCHQILSHYTSKNNLDELNKEIIFQVVYDGEKYNDSKLRFTFNRLLTAIREFVVISENEKNNLFTQKVWMDFIQDKKLKKNLGYNINEDIELKEISDYKFLFQFFKSQEQNFNAFSFNTDIRKRFDAIVNVMNKAEVFSDLVFIKNYCALISLTNVYQSIPFELPIEKFQEIKSKKWERNHPEIEVYIVLINLLLKNDKESYEDYKKVLFNNFDIWDDEEKVNLLIYLVNYSTSQVNRGLSEYIDELYQLFIFFESHKIFSLPSYINHTRINNIVHIYLRKKDFERAEIFVNKYVDLLGNDLIDSCRHFNLARIKFERKDYKTSLRELLQVDFGKDIFYSINSKFLLLKNYYELRESDALDSLCSSFKEYLRKNKVVSESHKLTSLNFIKMLDKIYGATPSKLKKLQTEIQATSQIAEKAWLIEKIEEKVR